VSRLNVYSSPYVSCTRAVRTLSMNVCCSCIFLLHNRTVVIYYSATFPRYLNRSCNMLVSRGSNVIVKKIMTTKWRKWMHRDSTRTQAPSKALRAITYVHFVLYLHVFSGCIVVPSSLYHYVHIARGDTLFYNSLRLMLFVTAYIQNAIVATPPPPQSFVFTTHT